MEDTHDDFIKQLNDAIPKFISTIDSLHPKKHPEILLKYSESEKLEREIKNIIDYAYAYKIDWSASTLVEAGDIISLALKEKYPDLSKESCMSIVNEWSYSNR